MGYWPYGNVFKKTRNNIPLPNIVACVIFCNTFQYCALQRKRKMNAQTNILHDSHRHKYRQNLPNSSAHHCHSPM